MKDFKNEVDASFIQPMFHFRRESLSTAIVLNSLCVNSELTHPFSHLGKKAQCFLDELIDDKVFYPLMIILYHTSLTKVEYFVMLPLNLIAG